MLLFFLYTEIIYNYAAYFVLFLAILLSCFYIMIQLFSNLKSWIMIKKDNLYWYALDKLFNIYIQDQISKQKEGKNGK